LDFMGFSTLSRFRVPRRALLSAGCALALAGAFAGAGCAGGAHKAHEPSFEEIERSEEAEAHVEEQSQLQKDRELLSVVESTQREEQASANAKKKEHAADVRAKHREELAEINARAKEEAAKVKKKAPAKKKGGNGANGGGSGGGSGAPVVGAGE
jgi:membrane protein involved in colicin uptake